MSVEKYQLFGIFDIKTAADKNNYLQFNRKNWFVFVVVFCTLHSSSLTLGLHLELVRAMVSFCLTRNKMLSSAIHSNAIPCFLNA